MLEVPVQTTSCTGRSFLTYCTFKISSLAEVYEYFCHHCVSHHNHHHRHHHHHHHHHHVVMLYSTYYSYSIQLRLNIFLLLLIGQKKGTRYHLFPPLVRLNIHRLGEKKRHKKKHKSNLIRSDLTTRGSRITFRMVEMFHYRMAFGPHRPDIWHLKCNLSGLQLKIFIV